MRPPITKTAVEGRLARLAVVTLALLVAFAFSPWLILVPGAAPSASAQVGTETISVNPDTDEVWANGFTPLAALTLTVGSSTYPGIADEWGNAYFDLFGSEDLAAGTTVTVTEDSGLLNASHEITSLAVVSVNHATETVSGTAVAGSQVCVDVWGGGQVCDLADGAGNWSITVSPFGAGAVSQTDDEGDATQIDWGGPPWFLVDQFDESLWGHGFARNSTVDVYHNLSKIDTLTTDRSGFFSMQYDPADTDFAADDTVRIFDGTADRTTTITELDITAVDVIGDIVSGVAAQPGTIWVSLNNLPGEDTVGRTVTVLPDGSWTTDFKVGGDQGGTFDLVAGSDIYAHQYDTDGDATHDQWIVPDPRVYAEPSTGNLWGNEFAPNSNVAVTVTRGGSDVYSTTFGTDEWGNWSTFNPVTAGLQTGDVVVADDGTTLKTLTVTSLAITSMDTTTEELSGPADDGIDVCVDMWVADWGWGANCATPSGGTWTLAIDTPEFDNAGLEPGFSGNAYQCEADNDCTWLYWWVPEPRFSVDPNAEGLWGNDFTPGSSVTVTVTRDTVDLTVPGNPFGTDEWGNFGTGFDPAQLDLQADDVVAVTDGATPKAHTVTALTVDPVNHETNIVSGSAAPGTPVWVASHSYGGVGRTVTANASGNWTTDFGVSVDGSGTFDVVPGDSGYAAQCDNENDCTQIDWRAPKPRIDVDASNENVWGNDFAPNGLVTVTVNGTAVQGSPFQADIWGNFGTNNRLPIDIVAGDTVVATDTVSSVTHVVLDLETTTVNQESETVSGTAEANSQVDVWVHDVGDVGRTVFADGNGDWIADFTSDGNTHPNDRGTADLGLGSNGNSNRCDAAGNCTYWQWRVANPYIGASVIHEEVWAYDFPDEPDGQTLYYRLDDPATPEVIDFESDMPLIVDQGGTQAGDRSFGRYDVQAGWVFTVRNRPFGDPGGMERVLNISHIEVTVVDGDANIITGYANPAEGPDVCVWSQNEQLCNDAPLGFTWLGNGDWIADFGAIGSDVRPGQWNSASQYEEDGDETHHWWNLPPWITVDLAQEDDAGAPLWPDTVQAEQWTGPVVTLVIERGGADLHNDSWTVTGDGHYTFELPGIDLDPGDTVTLSDSEATKSVTVEPLTIDQINFSTDIPPNTVYGTTTPQRSVQVTASATVGGWWAERWVNANALGDYTADFGVPGNGWREQWTADFGGADGLGRHMQVHLWDDDNDRVQTRTCEGIPRIEVARSDGRVDAYDFPEGATVTVTITVDGIDDTFSATSERNPENPCETVATIDVGEPIPSGATVTADDDDPATPPVTHTVIVFTIDVVDADADTVTGTAPAGFEVLVYSYDSDAWRYPIACDDPTEPPLPDPPPPCDGVPLGTWVADFSVQGDQPGEENVVDLGPGSSGYATVLDEYGNNTSLNWHISAARFSVDPTSEMLWANEFLPNTELTIARDPVDGDPAAVPGGPFVTDGNGNFDTSQVGWDPENPRSFEAGDIVVVSDGETAKDHTITALTVDAADPETNIVSGTAAPGAVIWVDVHEGTGESGRSVTAVADGDGIGQWSTDFDDVGDGGGTADLVNGTQGSAQECDIDNDCTQIQWRVLAPSFWVYPDGDFLLGQDMEPDGSVFVTVDPFDGPPETFGPFGTDGSGNFNIGTLPIDIRPGDLVTVSDLTTVKHHTVTPLVVTAASDVDDTVSGLATGDAEVQVLATGSGFDWRVDFAAPDGSWTMYFNEAGDENPRDLQLGDNGIALECDPQHDCTAANWDLRLAQFQVDPANEQLWANGFAGDTMLTLSRGPTQAGAVPLPGGPFWTDGDGNLGTGWDRSEVDLASGDRIWVSDGESTKDHTITSLTVDSVDPLANTVSGTAAPGSQVWVDIHNSPGDTGRTVTAIDDVDDGIDLGFWSTDFDDEGDGGGTWNLEPGTGGYAQQCDDEQDCTQIQWDLRFAQFQVDPANEQLWANGFASNTQITVSRGEDQQTAVPLPGDPIWTDGDGNVSTGWDQSEVDLAPGDRLWVTDGNTTKDHTITGLTVVSVDPVSNVVSGTAAPGSEVWVDIHNSPGDTGRLVTAIDDPNDNEDIGYWSADFGQPGDGGGTATLEAGTHGYAQQCDDEQDCTQINWQVVNPQFQVRMGDQTIDGWEWPEGETVYLNINDPSNGDGVDYSDNRVVEVCDWDPSQTCLHFSPRDEAGFEIQPGFEVELSTIGVTKTHTVTVLEVTEIGEGDDTVSGLATANRWVSVYVHETGAQRDVQANGEGHWTADFSTPGVEGHEQDTFDIQLGTNGEASESDFDGDQTQREWRLSSPTLTIRLGEQLVEGWDWPEGTGVTLTIDDPSNGLGVDYTDSRSADPAEWDPSQTYMEFRPREEQDFEVLPGFVMVMTDGITEKTHTVIDIQITEIDTNLDTVSGIATPTSLVTVHIHGTEVTRDVTTEGDGAFFADFANLGDEEHEQETWDIDIGTAGEVFNYDEDGDQTQIDWDVPEPPTFTVMPGSDYIQGDGWFGGPITVSFDTDEFPGGELYQFTIFEYDEEGRYFDYGFGGEFDVEPGQFVTVTDGTRTKYHWVTAVSVTTINAEAETVSGTAEPGSTVIVEADVAPTSGVWEHLVFQFTDGRFDRNPDSLTEHIDFRRAIAHAIDRDRVAEEVGGHPIDSYIDGFFGNAGADGWAQYHYDPALATELIDQLCTDLGRDCGTESGWTDPPVAYFTTTENNDTRQHLAGVLQEMLAEVGIEMVIDLEHSSIFFGETFDNRRFDLGEWAFLGEPDYTALAGQHQWFDPSEAFGFNPYGWGMPGAVDAGTPDAMRLTQLVALMQAETDTAILDDYFAEAEGILAENLVFVPLYIRGGEGPTVEATADVNGDWTADFSGIADLTPGTEGRANQADGDGDRTQVDWRVRGEPFFEVTATHDWVSGYDFEGDSITITFDENDTMADGYLHRETFDVDPAQYDWVHPFDWFDIESGQFVTVTDGITTKTTWVTTVEITDVDTDGWTMAGTAKPGEVFTGGFLPEVGGFGDHAVEADQFGSWSLDLAEVVDGELPESIPDRSVLVAFEIDEDSDRTIAIWDPAVIDGHVLVDGAPVAGAEVYLSVAVGEKHTCTGADGYFLFDNVSWIKAAVTEGLAATGRAVSAEAACSNPDYVDSAGGPLLTGFIPGPFALENGYEYLAFDVEYAVAYQHVVVEEFDGLDWVPADGVPVMAFDLNDDDFVAAYGADPDLYDYEQISQEGVGQLMLDFTGVYLTEPPGTVEMRYPYVTDVLILVEYDGTVLSDTTNAGEFGDRGDGVMVGPTIVFPNRPPVITEVSGPMVPLLIGSPASIMATFTDPNVHDAHTASFDWGDGHATDGDVDGWSAAAAHTYEATGVYEVTVTVTDSAGLSDTENFRFVVVYDPAHGFVTGGGWIHPEAGSEYPAMTLEDKVNLGFNVKYKSNSTEPQGELNVQLGGLHVHSDAINWLVITIENEAYFTGVATIDGGSELHPFRVNVIDGDQDIDPDRFEMMVFASGADPYNDAPIYYVTGFLQGGQVKIHKS